MTVEGAEVIVVWTGGIFSSLGIVKSIGGIFELVL